MINDLKTQREWKIELTIAMNFLPNNTNETHTKSDNKEIIIVDKT